MAFKIGDETFRTRKDVSLTWQVLQFQQAQRLSASTDPAKREQGGTMILDAMYALAKRLIAKDEWDRFCAFMSDEELDEGAFESAIGEAMANRGAEETDYPKEPSDSSSPLPTPTETISRHVSFS